LPFAEETIIIILVGIIWKTLAKSLFELRFESVATIFILSELSRRKDIIRIDLLK
jgi:hypothetical protein